MKMSINSTLFPDLCKKANVNSIFKKVLRNDKEKHRLLASHLH